jgi:cytoplasmic iron level regulating protein YaaA (DUF328/UPF0246 family)
MSCVHRKKEETRAITVNFFEEKNNQLKQRSFNGGKGKMVRTEDFVT